MSGWAVVAALVAGLLAWTFVEYLIHGILGHRFRTFVTPLHGEHHREPRAVFTSPAAWVPSFAIVAVLAVWLGGPAHGGAFAAGLLAGFLHYEWFHWRLHFRRPRNARERRLRAHHLTHHFANPRAHHGVTTRFWDRVFGTLPASWREDTAPFAEHPPLQGPSNLLQGFRLTALGATIRRARSRQG